MAMLSTISEQHSSLATGTERPASLPPSLPVLRFGLRQLFWVVTGLSLVLASLAVSPPGPTALALLTAVLVISAHVAGTAIGSRLRRHANERREWELKNGAIVPPASEVAEHSCDLAAAALPPTSPWYRRGSTALGWLPKLVIAGGIIGGLVGAAMFAVDPLGTNASLAGIAVGAISAAVLAAWVAFIGGSFYAIFRHGLREAMAYDADNESHRAITR